MAKLKSTFSESWLSTIADLYDHDVEAVEAWLTSKHPLLKLHNHLDLDIPLSPLEAVCYSQEEDVACIVDQLASGAYL